MIGVDMAIEGQMSKREAVMRVTPDNMDSGLSRAIRTGGQQSRGEGRQAAGDRVNVPRPGRRQGVLDADLVEDTANQGPDGMVRPFTKPDDVHGRSRPRAS